LKKTMSDGVIRSSQELRALRPNGMRLSCGAALEVSQTEFYYTAFQDVYRTR